MTYSLATGSHSDSLASAVLWVQSLLLGKFGTILAILAVAIAGLNMLWGRSSPRDGLRIIIGCFILFGASTIAQGLVRSVEGHSRMNVLPPPEPVSFATQLPMAPHTNPFDPYTGAPPEN